VLVRIGDDMSILDGDGDGQEPSMPLFGNEEGMLAVRKDWERDVIRDDAGWKQELPAPLKPYQLPIQDPFPNDTVLFFKKRFGVSIRTYSYAALKAAGSWYITNTSSRAGGTWEDIRRFVGEGDVFVLKNEGIPYRG
jgi:hypothetical protein